MNLGKILFHRQLISPLALCILVKYRRSCAIKKIKMAHLYAKIVILRQKYIM